MADCKKQYLRKVKRCLRDCPRQVKQQLLQGLGEELGEYMAQHPTGSLDDLIAVFRPPMEAAQELSENVSPTAKRRVRLHRRIALAVLSVMLACVIAGLGYWIWYLSRFQQVKGVDTIIIYPPYEIPEEIEGE